MKKLLILSLNLLFIIPLNAQEITDDYRPFIEEGKMWISRPLIDLSAVVKMEKLVEYDYFDGDTIVAGIPCKKWIQEYRNMEGKKLLSCFITMYEEDRKVWFFFKGEITPRLAYDFGAKEGDTLAIVSPRAYYYNQFKENGILEEHKSSFVDTIVITKISEEELLRKSQKMFYFHSISRGSQIDREDFLEYNYYMSGIGSHWSPNENTTYVGQNAGNMWLFYCLVGDEILYADEERAQYWGIPDPSSIKSFLKLPTVKTPSTQSLFDLSGRRLTVPSTSSSRSVLPKGVYIKDGKKRVRK